MKSSALLVAALLFAALLFANIAFGDTVFTFRPAESQLDVRFDYDHQLLILALEKTKKTHDGYELRASPKMNFARAEKSAKENILPNFFFKQSYKEELSKHLTFVPFPVDLGIVGYRICFVSKKNKNKMRNITTIDDLKRLTHGQGLGWADVSILRHHGFTVDEIPTYESLFKMVALSRIDLFCRGANELLSEYNSYKNIPNFTYDTYVSISYPLPRFFFTSKQNKAAAERVHTGLVSAYNDGSLQALWLKHYKDSIDFVQLDKRKIFNLDNPLLKGLDPSYKQYIYNPLQTVE